MPEYTLAGLVVLTGALALASVRGVARLRATWLGFAVFLAMTVVFDLLLTGLPIVTYGPGTNSGIALGPIPVEDFLYGQALYLVAIAAWGPRPSAPAGVAA
ncbi:MAG TPA: lycopene cyclase domain-containing protein [Candidatus Limnocylindrales bacterium]|nr:lycopene cyclase domain-containing protein [Candidatus Limnocylindrales bacterium]